MYFKDYSEPYVELQDPNIEIILKDMVSDQIEEKIIIWEGDFDSILSEIPLNEEGEYVALAYHQNIDFPWEKMEPDYWIMDYLNESLEQIMYVKDMIEDDTRKEICKDICRIINKAINNENSVLVRRN
ncbi:MAG: hypothetical protein HFI34_01455 [Lachnospiraceae bacterium]|nr:hypothetical protein [Lachnospiraceae bacterium]